jgi:hypothetical protein
VVHEDEADLVLMPPEAFHDPVDAVPRQPEYGVNAPLSQPLDQGI